ncbi:MAG: hydroxyphenylacetyl-CoA thioesterase PaaI [Polaromonas sp.]
MTPQELANAVGIGMMANDKASSGLGMRLTHISPGAAHMDMTVAPNMLNGHATCHGGYITTLADSAFAFACNSYNELTVASGLSVDFIAPAFEGDVLTARAIEVSLSGRTGVYDVMVFNQKADCIAVFRGRSHRIKGKQAVALGDNQTNV